MKVIALILSILLYTNVSLALDNFKKEIKILTEIIKSNYNSWSIETGHSFSSNLNYETSSKANGNKSDQILEKHESNVELGNTNKVDSHVFSDFSFTIVNNQAIVQFTVDHQLVSAFMEKIDGEWNLVCAARLDATS